MEQLIKNFLKTLIEFAAVVTDAGMNTADDTTNSCHSPLNHLPKNFTFLLLFIMLFSFPSLAFSLMVSCNTSSILSCTTLTVAGRSDYKIKMTICYLKL